MPTMNISLPEPLRDFIDDRVSRGGFGTSSEYVRELVRRDQERLRLRDLLTGGAESPRTGVADSEYFRKLRASVAKRTAPSRKQRRA